MTTDRSYRSARSPQAALDELRAHAGEQFAPDVVEAIVRVVGRELFASEGDGAAFAVRDGRLLPASEIAQAGIDVSSSPPSASSLS
jgi:hypothetical protein